MSISAAVSRVLQKRPSEVLAYLAAGPEAWRLVRRIDAAGLASVRARYRDAAPSPGYSKYLDARHWVHSKLLRVRRLGLDRAAPLRLLDLGTGPGYFPFIAAAYGHTTLGVDMAGVAFYDEITVLLGVRRELWTIRPFEPMPRWGVFDLITAFQVCFDETKTGLWGPEPWAFFLDDIGAQLAPGGRLVLEFNTEPSRPVADLLRARGFTVQGLISELCRPCSPG